MTAEGVRDGTNIVDPQERPFERLIEAIVGAGAREVEPVPVDMIAVPAEDADAHKVIAALRAKISEMYSDWVQLNEFLNATARTRDWCGDYERRLEAYNRAFTALKMVGRERAGRGAESCWVTVDGSDQYNVTRSGRPGNEQYREQYIASRPGLRPPLRPPIDPVRIEPIPQPIYVTWATEDAVAAPPPEAVEPSPQPPRSEPVYHPPTPSGRQYGQYLYDREELGIIEPNGFFGSPEIGGGRGGDGGSS